MTRSTCEVEWGLLGFVQDVNRGVVFEEEIDHALVPPACRFVKRCQSEGILDVDLQCLAID
eukprot:CAMPEP_0167798830 /NCGR_PEP_ID=MMETSP0111_2-20121227/16590_1 /TAXON_ID=91324 /ORGANISM="Lotharella globosa, Strain CCCM811" /LENGTH=60 /DNA_ID=CAMNT_0007693415 /DNA_START=314 /DNA_END=496 /DNA_ORIENTATION=+